MIVTLILTGCGTQPTQSQNQSTTILFGNDSAGATIEIEKATLGFTVARVNDPILGEGQSAIQTDGDTIIFSVMFPAGATIIYVGTLEGTQQALLASGTWTQQPSNLFAEDSGTWRATASN